MADDKVIVAVRVPRRLRRIADLAVEAESYPSLSEFLRRAMHEQASRDLAEHGIRLDPHDG